MNMLYMVIPKYCISYLMHEQFLSLYNSDHEYCIVYFIQLFIAFG